MLFQCKTCKAKDEHIATLCAQVKDLRKLVFAPQTTHPTLANTEMNAVLDGKNESIAIDEADLTPEQLKELDAAQREAAAILSGTY